MLFMNLLEQGWESVVAFAIVIILAFAYHEYAHALVADKLGDPTPRQHGRLTLNPLPHLSLAGLVMLFMFGFGGAYTPINPGLLKGKNPRLSHACVAVAGPIANFLMAGVFAVIFRFFGESIIETLFSLNAPDWAFRLITQLFSVGVYLNILLAVLNLLPIPPLDGFTILQGVLPRQLANKLDGIRQYGMVIILILFLGLPQIAGINIFGQVLNPIVDTLMNLYLG